MVQVPQQQLLQEVQLASLISGKSEDVIRVPGVNSREIVSDYYCDHMVKLRVSYYRLTLSLKKRIYPSFCTDYDPALDLTQPDPGLDSTKIS